MVKIKNETIVITDPCYFENTKPLLSKSTIYGDWGCTVFRGTKDEVNRNINEIRKSYDDIRKKYKKKKKISQENKLIEAEFDKKYKLGDFCADAGLVAVFLLKDILKDKSDECKENLKKEWIRTIIEDFTGEVEYEIDGEDKAHIVGIGNVNFYTIQTSL
jgi:hypothetical protein